MPRYIDADELIKRIFPYDMVDKNSYAINAKAIYEEIRKAPTADVVEVVRCKDCKYYKPQTGAQNWNSKVKYCCRSVVVKVKETDFCSFGERKHE